MGTREWKDETTKPNTRSCWEINTFFTAKRPSPILRRLTLRANRSNVKRFGQTLAAKCDVWPSESATPERHQSGAKVIHSVEWLSFQRVEIQTEFKDSERKPKGQRYSVITRAAPN